MSDPHTTHYFLGPSSRTETGTWGKATGTVTWLSTGLETGLQGISDADLMAEFRRRAATTTLYLDADRPDDGYKGKWQALVAWEHEQNPDGLLSPLREALHRIAGSAPQVMPAFAVNTTRYERPLDEVTE